jgi:Superfamily I DNA and RNA helicases and helicase subunits
VTEAYPSLTELRRGLSETDAHLTELRQRLASVEAQLAEVENRVIADCRVLATTVYRVYLYEHLTRAYDVVVIDEASMVIAPSRLLRCESRSQGCGSRRRL